MKQKILYGILVMLIVIQFIRPEQNNMASEATLPFAENQQVSSILKTACNDCHSSYANYPWYSNIQPVGWFLQNHINVGRAELNFDSLNNYSLKKKDHKLEEMITLIERNEMPLKSYTWLHPDAKLTAAQQKVLIDWAKQQRQLIQEPIQ